MEIRAKCRFDKETIKALAHVSVYKKSNPKKTVLVRTILYFSLIVLCLAEMFVFEFNDLPVLLIIIAILMIFLDSFFYFCLPRIQYKSLAKMKEAENNYVFHNNEIKVFTASAEYNGEAKIEYSLFVKVYETSRYFFLYQTNNQVFVVNKSTVENGSVHDIRAVLSGAIKGKYVICKY